MKKGMIGSSAVRYPLFDRMTELAMLLAIAVIGVDLACLVLGWPRLAYSSGAAVLLCSGAFIGRNVESDILRCAVATAVGGLLLLQLCSGLVPDLFPARHGLIGDSDVSVLLALIVLCGTLVIAALSQTDGVKTESAQSGDGC